MSTSYSISRFSKPKKNELKEITKFSEYENYPETDEDGCETGEYIQLFRSDSPYTENLLHTRFVVPMMLPETVTDMKRLFTDLKFPERSIKENKIHISFGNGLFYDYTDGTEVRRISTGEIEKYDMQIQTKCFAVKIRTLWDSSEAYFYGDSRKIEKFIPDLDKYRYVPVNNSLLAKAEIPFLIFERNKGRCFLERS